jgi:hypothetical protein
VKHLRTLQALACLLAFSAGVLPTYAAAPAVNYTDAQSQRIMRLLNGSACGGPTQVAQFENATPTPSPSPAPTFGPILPGNGGVYATPFPTGSPAGPPPVPTPTPSSSASPGPVFLVRPSGTPSIAPAGTGTAAPSPEPTGAPTLRPGYVAVVSDKLVGSTKPGVPGDAIGNVHIYYSDEVLVGDRAHYDGVRTITVTGNPYIINNTKDSVLYADKIQFDTVAQTAALIKGRGESSQGVEHGLVYFSAVNMKTDSHGVAHGTDASVTTCDRPRAGYHLTGRKVDVYPSDKIVITNVLLWLGAAAVFWLPRVVIPLRQVNPGERQTTFFPVVGYNSTQGYYVITRIGFGRDQYYTGTYDIEFYTKQGTTLGYDGTLTKKNGKRQTHISFQRIENHLNGQSSTQYNANVGDLENFSQSLRGQLNYTYNGNYGPFTNIPPSNSLTAQVTHSNLRDTQTYTFGRNSTGSQSTTTNYGITDQRNWSATLQNMFQMTLNRSSTDYTFFSETATANLSDTVHWGTKGADYELNYTKAYSKSLTGVVNKEPELQIRPYLFLQHFVFPIAPTFTIGEYNEPQTPETTQRAAIALNMGPVLMHVLGGDFQAGVNVNQYAYGTGDLKASIQQTLSLNSPIGSHVINNISYNEQNYNGPAAVPFSTIDLQNSQNVKSATDIIRFFNNEIYNLNLSFTTLFNGKAQPVTYQFTTKPNPSVYATLSGTFIPGPGQGFDNTTTQFLTPFGRGAWIQFLGTIDWKNKARIENKSIYYSRIIGDCYELQLQYDQTTKQINGTIFLLAFPSKAASFGIPTSGSVIPSSFNQYQTTP